MGGSFDPPHRGHIEGALFAKKTFKLSQVLFVPAFRVPLQPEIQTEASHRLKMLELAVSREKDFQIDRQELDRMGVSYTSDTLNQILKTHPKSDVFLILGLDQFLKFDTWKNVDEILNKASLIVLDRSKNTFPKSKLELSENMRKLVKEFQPNGIRLKSGKNIHFAKWNKKRDLFLSDSKKCEGEKIFARISSSGCGGLY